MRLTTSANPAYNPRIRTNTARPALPSRVRDALLLITVRQLERAFSKTSHIFLSSPTTSFTLSVTQYIFSALPFDFGCSEISYLLFTNP